MKRDIAKSQHLYSYMEQLRDEYESTSSGISVVSTNLSSVVCLVHSLVSNLCCV